MSVPLMPRILAIPLCLSIHELQNCHWLIGQVDISMRFPP